MTDMTKSLVILIMKGFSIKVVVVVLCFVIVVLTEEHSYDTLQIVLFCFLLIYMENHKTPTTIFFFRILVEL